jgi:ABC-2 type transport system ATP-binding protein
MLSVQNLIKDYGEFRALNDLSFSVERGRILGFLGPNGAGKTTTMRILTGFMPPTSGKVTIGGMDISADSVAIKKFIGYLPETPPLYPDMRVDEYLVYVAELKGVAAAASPHAHRTTTRQAVTHRACSRPRSPFWRSLCF